MRNIRRLLRQIFLQRLSQETPRAHGTEESASFLITGLSNETIVRLEEIHIATVLDIAIQEFPLHAWDIRSRIEGSANLSAESVPHLMAWIPQRFRMPWFVQFLPDSPLAYPVIYRFDIPQAVTDLTVVDNTLQISTSSETHADVTFHCDAETFVLMMYKRVTLDEAVKSSRLTADGDDFLVGAFDQWLKR